MGGPGSGRKKGSGTGKRSVKKYIAVVTGKQTGERQIHFTAYSMTGAKRKLREGGYKITGRLLEQ